MLKAFERFFPEVESYKGSKLGFLNFQYKLYLAIAIFLMGILLLGFMSIKHFDRLGKEFHSNQVKLINQRLDAICDLRYFATLLNNECIAAARYERVIEPGNNIKLFKNARLRLSQNLKTEAGDKLSIACEEFYNIYTNFTIFEVNPSKYLEFKKTYQKLHRTLQILEKELLTQQIQLLRTRIASSVKLTMIMFLILVITLLAGGWVIVTSIKTMVNPVRLIIKQFQKDDADKISYLMGISTEGMGAVAYHLKEAEINWKRIQAEFKDIARRLDEQCVDLVSGIKVQEVTEVQIHEAYKAINNYISEQKAMTSKANEQVMFLVTNLSTLQKIPFQLKNFVEQIQNLLNGLETKLDASLNTPLQFKDCALEINSLFEDLGFTSMKILEVVNILTEVAGQAELLAFNTAIEAARAGIKGLGFGVVSKEIAKLVERSQKAAVDLNTAVSELQNGMNTINQLVPQATISVEKTASFQELAREICSQTFQKIRACIDDLMHLNRVFDEIIIKSSEITREANQITSLEFKEKNQLKTMELDVLDYQLNVKEAVRIAGKIEESIGILKFLIAELRTDKSITKTDVPEAS
jgi:methyl-accepting chemotaxis protein